MSWCVDQQQVTEGTIPAEKDSLQRWTERSVWSLVCAMELGLVPSETNASTVSSLVAFSERPGDGSLGKTTTDPTEPFFSRKPSTRFAARIPPRSLKTRSNRGRRKSTSTGVAAIRNVYASRGNRKLDSANNSTIENFWKSSKIRTRRSEKREKREDFAFELRRNDCDTCPTCKRKCVEDEPSSPPRPARFSLVASALSRKRIDRKLGYKSERAYALEKRSRRGNGRIASVEPSEMTVPPPSNERSVRGRRRRGGNHRARCSIRAENREPLLADNESEHSRSTPPIEREYASETEPSSPKVSIEAETSIQVENEPDPGTFRFSAVADPSTNFHLALPTCPPIERIEEEILSDDRRNESPSPNENVREKKRWKSADGVGKRNETQASSFKGNKTAVARVNGGELAKSLTLLATISRKDEEYGELRRVTRGSTKVGKDHFVGKLVWGCCSGWWPAERKNADRIVLLQSEV